MKIAYVVKTYPRLSQTFIVNEILAHEAAGLEIEIFSLRPPKEEDRHAAVDRVRAPVSYLPAATAGGQAELERAARAALPGIGERLAATAQEAPEHVGQALALALAVRRRGITHLHAHFGNAATSVARLAGYYAGVPYSFTAHARDIFHENVRPADLARKLADAAGVVTVSEFNLAYLRHTYGAAATRVRRIYNGLDIGRFEFRPPRERPPLILSVGRLIEKKGFADLIDACALLLAEGRIFRCLIVGGGPLAGELAAQIRQLGLESRVQLLGPQPQQEVLRLMHEAAVFAAPCVIGADGDRDGLPTVLLEAMALGCPCVSTDVTGIPEILVDDVTGLLIAQHDPTDVATAVGRLLDDPALRERLAHRARALIEEEFAIQRNTARMRALFSPAAPAFLH